MRLIMCGLFALGLTLGFPVTLRAAGETESNDSAAVLAKAQAAAKKVKLVRYSATYQATGWLASFIPRVEGVVVLGDQSKWKADRFRAELKIRKPDSQEAIELTAGCDGERYYLIDPGTKTVHEDMDPLVMGKNGHGVQGVALSTFAAADPYSEEIKAGKSELREDTNVGGELCRQVQVKLSDGEVRWFFSSKDYLPRRFEWLMASPTGEPGAVQLTLTDLVVDPSVPSDPFKLVVPEGYRKTDQFAD